MQAGFLERRVALLYRNQRWVQLLAMVNASFLVWVAANYQDARLLAVWWSLALLVAGLRFVNALSYGNTPENRRNDEAAQWLKRARVGAAAGGLVWASSALLLIPGQALTLQLFCTFILAGMITGAVPLLASDRQAFRLFTWPIVLAASLSGFALDPIHLAFSVTTLLFLFIATRSADFLNQALLDSFRLDHEKSALLHRLEEAHEASERSNRLKTEFLANISHELRTPMNGILGLTQLLTLEYPNNAQRELLTPLRESADHLMRLIDNLIDLSSLEAGQTQLTHTAFIPSHLKSALESEYAHLAEEKGLKFSVLLNDEVPEVLLGDLRHLQQILQQLIGNAIKFTENGEIRVLIERESQADDPIRISFSVIDTGIGMSPETLKRQDSLLTQGDGSSSRNFGGLGIGLAIARRLVMLMQGRLEIESTPDFGSRVRFVLPFQNPTEAS